MSPKEKPTFYLYGIGYSPQELTLGHIVLEVYAKPMTARHSRFPELKEDELSELADSTPISGAIETSSEKHLGFGFQLPIVGEANVQWSGTQSRILTAPKGRRIVLKDPEKFFSNNMAKNDVVRNKLALWCTLSTRKYLLKKSTFREPVIWLLTGLYEFENASMSTLHSTVPSASLGLDAGITAALSGVPVGASFEIGNTTSAKRELQSEGTRVWAAQWQKLDAKYVKRRANAVATPVVQIQLSPDTSYSEGVLLGDHDDESDEEEAVEFVLGGPEELASMNSIEEDEKYEKALDTADAMISRGQR